MVSVYFMGAPTVAGILKYGKRGFILDFLFSGKGGSRAGVYVCVRYPTFNTA